MRDVIDDGLLGSWGITAGLDSKVTKKLITASPPFIEVDEIHTSVADCCNRVK